MPLNIEIWHSDSPYIERVWRSRSEHISAFTSIAVSQLDLVVWKQFGRTYISLQGPETQASRAPVPEDAEFIGILLKAGTYLPQFPVSTLVNTNVVFPEASANAFWLRGSAWHFPNYDNAETFVERLLRDGSLIRESVVSDVLRGHTPFMSLRSVQRRFLYASGLTHRTMQQIERARQAVVLLQEGLPIVDVTYRLGYFDQAHLTKSLKYFIGQTPTQITDRNKAEQLSLLYKTELPLLDYDAVVHRKQQKEAS